MRKLVFVFSIFFALFFLSKIKGQVRLPQIISDGLVLQRETELKIWGWASPNEKIEVIFLDKTYQTKADHNGNWMVTLAPLSPGGPFQMIIRASNQIEINDVLIGDVWLASGQSNMELPMRRLTWVYPEEIETSKNDFIRQFTVPQTYNFREAQKNLKGGKWISANPETVLDFSGVAYFFARAIFEKQQVPIGLISTSLGGSPAEAWMSEEALKQFPEHFLEMQRFKNDQLIKEIEESDQRRFNAWYQELNKRDEFYIYPDRSPLTNNDLTGWEPIEVPSYWTDPPLEGLNGVVWYRKTFHLPDKMSGKPARLILGCIVDADSVFINGTFVGTTSYQYPPRRYNIPEGLLRPGDNNIVVRVISNIGRGGFVPDKTYALTTAQDTLDLSGKWYFRIGARMEPLPHPTFIRWKPGGLYNAMIAPLLNYRIKGVIWYQGESNVGRAEEYRELFPALIRNWRKDWQQGNFPFLYVQLANFLEPRHEPGHSQWALLREAQMKALSEPVTAMAVTIDIGEWNDIHPLNKKDVGYRLSLAARSIAYGEKDLIYSGPVFESMEIRDGKAIISFTHTGSGLTTSDGEEPSEFEIAGCAGKFFRASARIENNKVIVWSDQVPDPVSVRYAWADNPETANLINREGLPAPPFRTDDF